MSLPFQTETWKSLIADGAGRLGISVTNEQAGRMAVHAEELLRWNTRKNLTAITDPQDVAVKHFIDSLVPAASIPDHSRVIDIGSGGGFPGIPLKILNPTLAVTLVDASRKKVNFLKQVIRLLDLDDTRALHERVENLRGRAPCGGEFDVAVSRAFTDLSRLVETARPLLTASGRLIAMKSRKAAEELRMLGPDADEVRVIPYTLPFQYGERSLIIL